MGRPNAWAGSTRRETLPPDWPKIRERVLDRDGRRCRHIRADTELRCTELATDVDHVGDRLDHSDENLVSKCGYHHLRKTAAEANRARALTTTARRALEKRGPEQHPGVVPRT